MLFLLILMGVCKFLFSLIHCFANIDALLSMLIMVEAGMVAPRPCITSILAEMAGLAAA